VVGIYKETASGARNDRVVRQQVIDLAHTGAIQVILVTELSRWGRSTIDLVQTLQELQERGVAVIASTGMRFDLSTPHGRMLATMLACVAEFERDLLRERVRSGLAAARARGVKLGRPFGTRVKSDPLTPEVLARVGQGSSYRAIARELKLSKNTVLAIVSRERSPDVAARRCQR